MTEELWAFCKMHKAYVADAAEHANVDWTHVDALDPSKAKDILAYMSRYAKMEHKPNDMSYEEFVSGFTTVQQVIKRSQQFHIGKNAKNCMNNKVFRPKDPFTKT